MRKNKRKRFILGRMLIFLGLIFLLYKTLYSYTLFSDTTYGMPALIKKGHADQLFLGSSMFRQGIDIQVLNEKFPEKENYILAYNGNQPIWEYYQLKYLLENEVTIDTLYLDMYIYSAIEEPQLNDEKMFLEFTFPYKREIFGCIKESLSGADIWQIWVGSCNEMLFFWPIYKNIINSQFENGGTKTINQGASKQLLDELMIPDLSADINPIQYLYIKKIVEITENEDIEIIFIETPKYIKLDEDKEYIEKMEMYRDIIASMGIKELEVVGTFDETDPLNYIDLMHLSEKGRKEFTSIVCDTIELSGDNENDF